VVSLFGFFDYIGFCYRLANFNIDTVKPTFRFAYAKANALFILSLPLVLKYTDSLIIELLTTPWFY
jgi:CDP-diacylglycerol--serine O-phosphatidyltransferase